MWSHESAVPLFHINGNTYHHKCYHCNNMNQIHNRYIYIIISYLVVPVVWEAGEQVCQQDCSWGWNH